MCALLLDALKPNLVQTLEGTPCLMHGGPFANIAHGCNSVRATRLAMSLADYTITEAGFGSDLGAEKFFDIKCPAAGIAPDAVVLVATVRALKYNGGIPKEELGKPDAQAVRRGLCNLEAHITALQKYGVPVVVAINRFDGDTAEELAMIGEACRALGARMAQSEVFAKGGRGGTALAREVLAACEQENHFAPLCTPQMTVRQKIETIAREIYGAAGVEYSEEAEAGLRALEALGASHVPVCIAKTQYSLSDDPKALGCPQGFTLHVREVRLSAGAGFAVALTGSVLTMPGLPKKPAAEGIDVTPEGKITGLF
jgi:formate--tetrahydrofolate ligase